ncbi:hypothetical protein EIP86_003049 [Pleurotus ostreatoroseus]|nr:hypothetical protein EIP86_003049 [Pleurotus ostreatoroseus]
MPAVARRRVARNASNAENLVPRKQVPYKAARRITPCNPLRESSLRRRNRVLSGLSPAPPLAPTSSIAAHIKRQRLASSSVSAKPAPMSVTLPTPPTTPGSAPVELEIRDVEMSDEVSVPQRVAGSHTLRIPRTLRRPASSAIPQAAVHAADPQALAGVPAPYVRDATRLLAPGMFKAAASVQLPAPKFTVPPGHGLPKALPVRVRDRTAEPPSHLLAVQALARPTSPATHTHGRGRAKVELYPVHHLVLATQCARLSLPASSSTSVPEPTPESTHTHTLPVVPIALPHPDSFPLLHHHLYHHDAPALLAALLPPSPSPSSASPSASSSPLSWSLAFAHALADLPSYAALLADTYAPRALLRRLLTAFGVYANACVLGVRDEGLWAVLGVAWEVLALAAAASAKKAQVQAQAQAAS